MLRWLGPLALLALVPLAAGCHGSSDADNSTKLSAVSAPVDNKAPEAAQAQGAPPPVSGLPPPGGPKKMRR